jgi:tetratricopeptide (TPR) repeat protein
LVLLGEYHPQTARGYFHIGFTHGEVINYDEAFCFYNKSIGLYKRIFGNSHSQIAIMYIHYAIINQKLGEYDAGLQYLNRAFAILSPDFPEELYGADYNPVLVLHDTYYLKALSVRGSILSDQGHFSESLGSYLAAINHIENIRTNLRSDDSNHMLSERYFAIFEHGIDASMRLYKITGNFVFKQLAFEISKSSKAATLRYSVAQSFAHLRNYQ